jgi:Tfp pilus assembly protein PilX
MRNSQRGSSLIITIIALTTMLVSALAVIRSTAGVQSTAGNIAIKQLSLNAADVGILNSKNDPVTGLLAIAAASTLDTTTNTYFAVSQATDTNGLPVINWNNVSKTTLTNGFTVQYVTERMCTGTVPITAASIATQCMNLPTSSSGGSYKAGSGSGFISTAQIYYRTTIMVTGPKNALAFVQIIYAM